jgi:hypothetical protein
LQFAKVMGFAKGSTHPAGYARSLHVIASASEAIHPAAESENGLVRRFTPRNDGVAISGPRPLRDACRLVVMLRLGREAGCHWRQW